MRNIKHLVLIAGMMFFFYTSMAFGVESTPVYEQYYLTKIKDAQIGYSFESQETQQGADKNLIITNRHYELKFKRLGFTLKIVQDLQYVEDDNGSPVSFSANIESKGEIIKVKGEFLSDKRLHVTSNVNGETKSQEIELNKKIIFPYAIQKLFQASDNETIEYSAIDPTNDVRIVTITAKKVGTESLVEDTFQGDYTKYKVSVDFLPTVTNFEWYNSEGKIVKEKSSLLGLEKVATNKNKIIGNIESFDIFYKSLIPVNTHIPNPFYLDQAVYKIETQSENPEELFIYDERQKIIQTRGNEIYLKIKSQQNAEKYSYPVQAKEYSEFLKSGPYITSKDESIINQAKIIAGNKKDAYEIAKAMEKWVYDAINTKDLSVNFANASEVMKLKQGDCTEHSVLLAALLRSIGIPSKVVVGLMYTSIPEDSFVYHMWVKAYVGKWIGLDPSFPSENFSPVHIALTENDLNQLSSKTDIVLDVIKSFTTLKINVLNYTTLSNNIIGINISTPENPWDNITLKADENGPIKTISLKSGAEIPSLGSEMKKKYMDDYTRAAFYNFSKGKITDSINEFEKVSKLIPYNDDFSDVKLALKLSTFGLFNLADKQLKNVYDDRIWELQIKNIKSIYYPKEIPSSEHEIILAEALSKINFQNAPTEAITLINSESALGKYDYAHYLLAKANLALNKTDLAITELEKAIEVNPSNLSYRMELAKANLKKNDFKKAKREIDYILKQNIVDNKFKDLVNTELYWLLFKDNRKDNTRSQYYMAKYYQVKGEYKAAIDVLNKLITEKQEDSYIYELLGDVYLQINQLNDAKSSYQSALKLDKKSAAAVLGLGNILKLESKYKESLDEYLKAEKIDSESPELILAIADGYNLLSQEETAYKYYEKLLNLDNYNCTANYNVGLMYLNSGKTFKAEEYFKKVLSVNPNHSKSWLELAKIELDKKNYFLAKTYLDSVNYLGQDKLPQYYYYTGLIEKNNENNSSARFNFQKAIELKPDYKEALQSLDKLK